jgi:hypothetical protein
MSESRLLPRVSLRSQSEFTHYYLILVGNIMVKLPTKIQ